jgi:peptide/nickel transport system substrate-binding protein
VKHSKRIGIVVAIAAVCAAAGGWGAGVEASRASSAPPLPTSGECEATVAGSQLDYGIFAPNAAFDPVGTSGALVGGTENAAVWDVLFIYDTESGEIVPHLAESLTADNEDNTSWTLKLREGITYSDGTALTAQLVSDNIDRFFAPEGVRNTSGGFLQYIEEKEVVDDVTLHMTLNTPFAEFPQVFADEPGMIVNTNAIGDDIDAFRVQPPDAAGLGPYVVERNVPGEETVLTARQDYWGGPVCIETIRFVWIPGAPGTYDAFKNGDIDAAFLRDPIVNATALADGAAGFFFNQDGGAMFNFNHREGHPTADPRVREAIMLAIDPSVINDRAFQGQLDVTKAYLGRNSRYWTDAVQDFPTDSARAAELVEEAKADGWDGSIAYVATAEGTGPDIALAVEGMLGAVGIEVQTEQVPQTDMITRLGAGEFDLIGNGFNSGPDTMVLSLVRNLSSTSPTNRMGYVSEAMDALLAEALATPYADLAPVLAQINDQINADFAAVTYGATSEGVVWADNVSGIIPTFSSIFLFHAASIGE